MWGERSQARDTTRRRHRIGSRAAALLALALTGLVLAAAPASAEVTPILECSFLDTGTGEYNTVWGYDNTGKDTDIKAGTDQNQFDNPSSDAGQPSTFASGIHNNVFIVTHTGSSTWALDGSKATAPGKACKENPVSVVSDSLGSLVALALVTLVLGVILFWVSFWRPRRS